MRRLFLIAVGLMSIIPLAATAMAAPEPLTCGMPKIQSFDFLLDCSGSMMMRHNHLGRSKFELAKQILRRVNDRIPEPGQRYLIALLINAVLLKRQSAPGIISWGAFVINVGAGLRSHTRICSIIGDEGLNFRVRNGAGCAPFSMDANKF